MPEDTPQTIVERAPVTLTRIMGNPGESEITLINRLSPRELVPEDVFVFEGMISTDALDSYGTRMDPKSTLPNFVREMKQGRPLMNSHRTGGWTGPAELNIGKSFDSELVRNPDAEGQAVTTGVLGRYYILRNTRVNGLETNDFIRNIEGGVHDRMSVGFTTWPDGKWRCDLDGVDILTDWDWECGHWPGFRTKDGTLMTATYEDSHQVESSLVYANSTPGALVQRAMQAAEQGRMDSGFARAIEARYGMRGLADSVRQGPRLWTGHRQEENKLNLKLVLEGMLARVGKTISAATKAAIEDAIAGLEEGITSNERAMEVLSDLLTTAASTDGENSALSEVRSVLGQDLSRAHLEELVSEAVAGRAYKESLIEDAVKGRAGTGITFDEQRYRSRLQGYDINSLKEEVDTWNGLKGARFPVGADGRRRSAAQNPIPSEGTGSDGEYLPL